MSATITRCQHEGCNQAGFECRNFCVDEEEFPPEFYCGEHAFDHGFCNGCGDFNAGIESFEFLHPGLCDNCYSELRDDDADMEQDEYEEWEDEHDGPHDDIS
jgi:hypothetical protein